MKYNLNHVGAVFSDELLSHILTLEKTIKLLKVFPNTLYEALITFVALFVHN